MGDADTLLEQVFANEPKRQFFIKNENNEEKNSPTTSMFTDLIKRNIAIKKMKDISTISSDSKQNSEKSSVSSGRSGSDRGLQKRIKQIDGQRCMFCGAIQNDRMKVGGSVRLQGCHLYEVKDYNILKTGEGRSVKMESLGLETFHHLNNYLTLCEKCHNPHYDHYGFMAIDLNTKKLIVSMEIRDNECSTGATYGSLHGKEIVFKNRKDKNTGAVVQPPDESLEYRFTYFENRKN
jgi:hypothetical protein